jgi:signal transduction histidine kinase
MIEDLLDLTRTRFGDLIPVTRAPIDLDPLCRQVIAEFEGLGPPGALRFTAKGNLCGEWDADRISQVLSNLVRNAVQHGVPGEPISLVARDDGEAVVVEVHNSGPAISPRALATLFEPMVRHVKDDRANAGLGLGLYIASQVVLAHGGTLDVTSTDAAGTVFAAHLPRHAARARVRATPAAE